MSSPHTDHDVTAGWAAEVEEEEGGRFLVFPSPREEEDPFRFFPFNIGIMKAIRDGK